MELLNRGSEGQFAEKNNIFNDEKGKFNGISEVVSIDELIACSTQIPRNLHIIKHIEVPEKHYQYDDEEEEDIDDSQLNSKGKGTIPVVFSVFAFFSILLCLRVII